MDSPSPSLDAFHSWCFSPSHLDPSHFGDPLDRLLCEDDVSMDLDDFDLIMQEPQKLADYIGTEPKLPSVSPVSLAVQCPEQPSCPALSPEQYGEDICQDREWQAWKMQKTEKQEERSAGETAESSQSDGFSQQSELSFDSDERPRIEDGPQSLSAWDPRLQGSSIGSTGERNNESTEGFGATNLLEHDRWDLKSNGSSTTTTLAQHTKCHPEAPVLVDLTDTDSDCEAEFSRDDCKVKGKRKLPSWVEPGQKQAKEVSARPLLHEELPRVISKPSEAWNLHEGQAGIYSYNSSLAVSRKLPSWVESGRKQSKEISARTRPHEEVPNLSTKPNVVRESHESQAGISSYNSSSALSLFRYGSAAFMKPSLNLLDQTLHSTPFIEAAQGIRGIVGLCAKPDSAHERVYSTSGLNDSVSKRVLPPTLAPQITSAKDYVSALSKEPQSRGLLKGLDDIVSREEACPDEGLMAVPLLKHQRMAVAWMEKKEKGAECAGGILADDQGLGKTVSTIALILKSKPPAASSSTEELKQVCWEASAVDLDDEEGLHKEKRLPQLGCTLDKQPQEKTFLVPKGRPSAGTLVVCPTSVLRQWAQEIKEKVTEAAGLSVLLYHGSNRTKDPSELAKYDVVLTTYAIVSMEVPKQPLPDEKEADERNPAQYGLTDLTSFEEKQKSAAIGKKKKAKGKKADTDALDMSDAGPLAKVAWFRVVLDEAQNIKNRRTQAARACWGLRAKRRWCLSGTPIQNAIDDLYSYFRFLKYDPFCAYKAFRSEIKDPIARDPSYGYRKLQYILPKVMLRRTKTTLIDGEPIITLPKKSVRLQQVDFSAKERAFYTNLETQSREQFKMYAASGTVQSNYVNILWMLLRLRQACDHPHLVKSHHSDAVQKSSAESVSKLSDEKRAILLSVLERNRDTCNICLDAPDDAVITLCGHVFCRQCISDRLTHDDCTSCPHPKCHAPLNTSLVYSWSALKHSGGDAEGRVSEPPVDSFSQSSQKDVPESSSKITAIIDTLRALPRLESSRIARSVKEEHSVERLDNEVSSTDAEEIRTEKAIVFSQWTSMLDLLELSLKKEGFCYRRLDGTMSIQSRDHALSDFKLLPKVTVMIMSLKAASLGLNMVAASHVLLIDVWWNPTTEEQAIDRAHRIGQTRDVHVSRFTVKNTIEDRILALQDRKKQMVASAFGEDASTDQGTRLTVDEMRYLFRM